LSASYAWTAPPRSWSGQVIQGLGSSQSTQADGNFVGPDYLESLGVPGVTGRGISTEDIATGKRTAVINRNLAETLWPGESALGRMLIVGRQKQPVEVVGVVPNGAFSGFIGADGEFAGAQRSLRRSFIFLSEGQSAGTPGERTLHVRYKGSLEAIAPAVRAILRDVDRRVPVAYVRTMNEQLDEFTRPAAMVTTLLGLFSIGSLILATIGLHSVVAFHTARRRRDFGIRIALGASYAQVVNTVLKEGLLLTSIGVLIGLGLSAATGRALRNLLFGVTPTDTLTYLAVVTVLGAVSLFACYLPARRASRISPIEALRQE
jgi:ABC-type antimicrobial peptide transport system permease subunit